MIRIKDAEESKQGRRHSVVVFSFGELVNIIGFLTSLSIAGASELNLCLNLVITCFLKRDNISNRLFYDTLFKNVTNDY